MAKQAYVKGSQGSKPTPNQIPTKPVNFSITKDVSLFQAPGNRGQVGVGGSKPRGKK